MQLQCKRTVTLFELESLKQSKSVHSPRNWEYSNPPHAHLKNPGLFAGHIPNNTRLVQTLLCASVQLSVTFNNIGTSWPITTKFNKTAEVPKVLGFVKMGGEDRGRGESPASVLTEYKGLSFLVLGNK